MIEQLQHRVTFTTTAGDRWLVPCDSDRQVVVALVPVDNSLAFSDRLVVLHRATGAAVINVEFPPCEAGLERAKQACAELLALPISWHSLDLGQRVEDHELAAQGTAIWQRALQWVSNFWSMVEDGGE